MSGLLPWATSHNGRGDALVIEEDRGDGSPLGYTAMEIAKCRTMREARAIVAARSAQIEAARTSSIDSDSSEPPSGVVLVQNERGAWYAVIARDMAEAYGLTQEQAIAGAWEFVR